MDNAEVSIARCESLEDLTVFCALYPAVWRFTKKFNNYAAMKDHCDEIVDEFLTLRGEFHSEIVCRCFIDNCPDDFIWPVTWAFCFQSQSDRVLFQLLCEK